MDYEIGLFREEEEIGKQLGKRSRPSPTWTTGKKYATIEGPKWTKIQLHGKDKKSKDWNLKRNKLRQLLSTQMMFSTLREGMEPLRKCFEGNGDVTSFVTRLGKCFEEIMDDQRAPVDPNEEANFRHEQETWSLLATLLPHLLQATGQSSSLLLSMVEQESNLCILGNEDMKLGILKWLRVVSRTHILQQLETFHKLSAEERYLRTLGLLIAAGLNLDAARLAMAEGEINLSQLLMCRTYPNFISHLMGSYLDILRDELKEKANPLLIGIFDLLAGKGDWLLDQLNVDWRIQLAVTLSVKQDHPLGEIFQVYHEEHKAKENLEDIQFQLLSLLVQSDQGGKIRNDDFLKLLKMNAGSRGRIDELMAWQLFTVLSSSNVFNAEDQPPEEEVQLIFDNLCEECEALDAPEWSIFVALHQDAPAEEIEIHIKKILEMNTSQWIDDAELQSFLRHNLSIQPSWIASAKAAWYKSLHNHEEEFECLVEAGCYEESHRLLFLKSHPEDLTSSQSFNVNAKVRLLCEKNLIEHQHLIFKWDYGGGLILSLQSLCEKRVRTKSELLSLLEEIKNFQRITSESRAFWIGLSDSANERLVLAKMFGLMMIKVERKYCDCYGHLFGSDHIMTRVLIEGCEVREQRLRIETTV